MQKRAQIYAGEQPAKRWQPENLGRGGKVKVELCTLLIFCMQERFPFLWAELCDEHQHLLAGLILTPHPIRCGSIIKLLTISH